LSAPSKAQLFSTSSLANAVESATNASTNASKSRTPESGKTVRRRSLNIPYSVGKKSEILARSGL